ncbi:MAG: hypothetical protein IEMM0006_1907 [bacterium]|nr:MAG: hypothetical protein IEMM0006_1907 [bacterium]
MKKLELGRYGVLEMDGLEIKKIDGGISFYQNGTMIDKDGTNELFDTVVSFVEGFFHGLFKK